MNSMEKENNKLHQNINRLKQEKQKLKTDLPEEDLKKLRFVCLFSHFCTTAVQVWSIKKKLA